MNKDMLIKRVLSYSSPFPKGVCCRHPRLAHLGSRCVMKVQLGGFKNIPYARPPNNSNELSSS